MDSSNGSVHDQKLQPRNGATRLVSPIGFPQYGGSRSIGHDLTPADLGTLETRWIDPDLARRAGLRRVDSLTGAEIVGRKGGDYSGIAIPYFHPGSERVRDYRLRRDHPDMEYNPGAASRSSRSTSARRADPTCSISRLEFPNHSYPIQNCRS